MEIIKHHTLKILLSFLNEKSRSLEDVNAEIANDLLEENIEIIYYLDILLNQTFNSNGADIASCHIHFEEEFKEKQKLLLAEFIIIKFHFDVFRSLSEKSEDLNYEIKILNNKINNFSYPAKRTREFPLGVTTAEFNKISNSHKKNKELVKFYKKFNIKVHPKLLFNTTVNIIHQLSNCFELSPFAKELENDVYSSNLLNSNHSLNSIDLEYKDVIDSLNTIVLFDCERKKLMTNFSFEEINKWNTDYNTRFTKYLIVTFGKEFSSVNHTRNKLELIRERFKIPSNATYTITKSEIDLLLNRNESLPQTIDFIGRESSAFWDTFVLETSIRELYELRSIKLMNIYSICYTDEIKNYILFDLFSLRESAELISTSTKMAILELRDDDIKELKDALSNSLDLIINSNIYSKVVESLSNSPTLVLDEAILRNQNLLSKIKNCLALSRSTKLKTWSDLLNSKSNYFLILSYRDQGRYPNYYYQIY